MTIHKEVEEIRRIIIEAIARATGVYGINETVGRIYGLLYFEEEPLNLDQLAKKLGVSKATVSNNVRLLFDLSMVKKVWQKGSRKDYYVAERDFEKIIQELLRRKEKQQLVIMMEAVNRATPQYNQLIEGSNQEKREAARADLKKIEHLVHWMKIAERWINFLVDRSVEEVPEKAEINEIEVEWDDGQ